MTLTRDYFDQLYSTHEDPWDFRRRWYEARKRALTLAALTRPRYATVFEPGCSIGELSAVLAERCDALLACDCAKDAVATARQRLASYPHARVEQCALPGDWPAGTFELIVLSEIGYYFNAEDLTDILKRAVDTLSADGVLLACHWRPVVADYPLTGDSVHALIAKTIDLPRLLRHEEDDFLLELWSREDRSVAQAENLR